MSQDKSKYQLKICVETEFLDIESLPDQDQFVFSYKITLINQGSLPAKLLSRHWIIKNAREETFEVQGDGVVGEQPTIYPDEAYCYTSGTVLDTAVGTMHGSYQLMASDGQYFEAEIAPFVLAAPGALH